MSEAVHKCEHCGRDNFMSKRGLSKHKLENKGCKDHLKARFGSTADSKIAAAYLPVDTVHKPQRCAAGSQNAMHYPDMADGLGAKRAKYMFLPDKDFISAWLMKAQSQLEQSQVDTDSDADIGVYDAETDVILPPSTEESSARQRIMLDNFKDYAKRANNFVPLDSNKFVTAITLLQTLRRTKASLDTYEAIMRWKLESQGLLRPGESLAKSPHYISREQVYKKLKERCNRLHGFGVKTEIVLPGSKSRAMLITSEPHVVMQQLLIDPRVLPEHYLFNDKNDPFAPPSADLDYIADLNTGLSYLESWKRLITKPGKQILCPIIIYIDGAATGQFVDLPITAVKIALGIHTRLAREKPYLWGAIGYIPQPTKVKSGGQRELVNSGHPDGTIPYFEMLDNEGQVLENETKKRGKNAAKDVNAKKTDALQKAQDLHAMLDHILAGLVKLQKEGLKWDLIYNGRTFNDVEFVFFVPFVRCDTDEADKLCGAYTNRTANVKQLCRYCCCPTNQSDNIRAKFKKKTPKMIGKLVEKRDTEGLKMISQQNLHNAFHRM